MFALPDVLEAVHQLETSDISATGIADPFGARRMINL